MSATQEAYREDTYRIDERYRCATLVEVERDGWRECRVACDRVSVEEVADLLTRLAEKLRASE